MGNMEKDKQTQVELNRTHDEELAKSNEAATLYMDTLSRQTPLIQLTETISQLQAAVREQQLKHEQRIQYTLQQANSALQTAQIIDEVTKQIKTLAQAASQQGPANNMQYFEHILLQLEKSIHEQRHQADLQMAQSLQLAVNSLTQSQQAMFDSQAYSGMAAIIKQCEQTLAAMKSQTGQPVN